MKKNHANVLVTGASRGLGLATAKRLKKEGYTVIATSRQLSAELKGLLRKGRGREGEVHYEPFDLSNISGIHSFVKKVTLAHGHLFGLVNNAALGYDGVLATMHDAEIKQMIEVNLSAAVVMAKYAARSMLLNKEGRIINISSIISHTGFSGLSVYGATKAALIGFARSLARELGPARITVNNIAPGYMQTDMTRGLKREKLDAILRRSPMKKLVSVEDVAGAVVFLLGDDAQSITGTTMTIDAGSSA